MNNKELFGAPAPTSHPSNVSEPVALAEASAGFDEANVLERAAQRYAEKARAAGTLQRYAEHWAAFAAWCEGQALCALPAAPKTVAMYIAARADQGIRPTTLGVTLGAIASEHRRAKLPAPTKDALVEETWNGIRRQLGSTRKKKAPLSAAELRRMMDELPSGLIGLRDRALLLLGFAGGFRRAELVALSCADLKFVPEGLEAFVARSKTDQERKGDSKVVAYGSDPSTCPVRAVKDWLELSGLAEGPVFRPINRHEQLGARALTAHAVAIIVKRTAAAAGMPTPDLSGHSLRAGFVTEASQNGADYPSIMAQTGHKELATVHGYNRRKEKWRKPASSKLGL